MTIRNQKQKPEKSTWRDIIARYEKPHTGRSLWQVSNSVLPYIFLWYGMYLSLSVSYWITFGLAIIAAGFLVRIFIIFHDCGHGAFFKSKRANTIMGNLAGVLTLTPYNFWRHDHAIHHATAGNLDRRGVGDIWTLTVKEYRALPRWRRIVYRLYRNPLVMFGVGPIFLFLIRYRLPHFSANGREYRSILGTNLGIIGVFVGVGLLIGFKELFLIQIPITLISSSIGIWLFYVQHQFDGVYWERHENWDYLTTALEGSSFYRLPKVLQWFTGNIGFHHIHHLSSKIPNYFLEKCHEENPLFQQTRAVTFLSSLNSLSYKLWDEERHQLIGFRDAVPAAKIGG